jgi:hypothetical protein
MLPAVVSHNSLVINSNFESVMSDLYSQHTGDSIDSILSDTSATSEAFATKSNPKIGSINNLNNIGDPYIKFTHFHAVRE